MGSWRSKSAGFDGRNTRCDLKKPHREGAKNAKDKQVERTREEIETVATQIVDAIVAVHRELGPGLLESTYQACLAHELLNRGIDARCELELPVNYKGLSIDAGYRIDMLVANCVIVENKSVQALAPIHEAQLLTYLRLSGCKLGFLVNWNVPLVKDGIKRMVNRL
jgi:GxxExxY protein